MVKMGGHALDDLAPRSAVLCALAIDIKEMVAQGVDVVVVHGGGPQIGELLARVGLTSQFLQGLRVTDAPTMDVVAMALARVNAAVVASLNHSGVAAVGVSGVDGAMITAPWSTNEWGRIAPEPRVAVRLLRDLLRDGWLPVVSPVSLGDDGILLNCNADTAAGAIAGALGADSLVLLSDVDQLRGDPDDAATALERVHVSDVDAMIASGAARDGMRPKMTAALDALSAGAQRVLMANGTRLHAVRDVLAGTIPTTEVLP